MRITWSKTALGGIYYFEQIPLSKFQRAIQKAARPTGMMGLRQELPDLEADKQPGRYWQNQKSFTRMYGGQEQTQADAWLNRSVCLLHGEIYSSTRHLRWSVTFAPELEAKAPSYSAMNLTFQLSRDTRRSAPRFDLHDNNSVDCGRDINKTSKASDPLNHRIHQRYLSSSEIEVRSSENQNRNIPAFLNPQMSIYEHRSLPIPEELQDEYLQYSKSVLVTENNRCLVCTSPIASNSRVARTNYGTVHFKCLRCYECNCHLEHSQLYFSPKTNAFYCHADYHEIFSNKCAHCTTPIEGRGMFALGKHWHVGHFFCSECSNPFDRNADYMTIKNLPICGECYAHKTASKCWKCNHKLIGSSQAIEALGRIWCNRCFSCEECDGPFYDDQFILRENGSLVCENCEQVRIKKAIWGD